MKRKVVSIVLAVLLTGLFLPGCTSRAEIEECRAQVTEQAAQIESQNTTVTEQAAQIEETKAQIVELERQLEETEGLTMRAPKM